MKRPIKTIRDQQGQVAIIVAIVIGLLIVVVGLVVDLGYLYTRKTELQNAADAAALAGAKELNGTPGGIDDAVERATELLLANSVDFGSKPIDIKDENVAQIITFASSPSGPVWYSAGDAKTNSPADKLFIKVDTSGIGLSTVQTWFMRVTQWGFGGIESTSTFGLAVAGRTVCETLPIFTCSRSGGAAPNYGFVVGTSYRLVHDPSGSNIGPGNVGWMDPVPPGTPSLITGTNEMREFLCNARGYCITPGTYTTLTQPALPETFRALNTRFGTYHGSLNDAEHKQNCPADRNIKSYPWDGAASTGAPRDWLVTPPTKQGLDVDEAVGGNGLPRVVHWSAVRPATSAGPPAISTDSTGYPTAGTGVTGEFAGTPYGQTTGSDYYQAPPAELGGDSVKSEADRRILTIGIATNCGQPGLNGSGAPVVIAAFGRFFMQAPAVSTGGTKEFYGEFLGIAATPDPVVPEIKLYR